MTQPQPHVVGWVRQGWGRWPRWSAYGAVAWSAVYALAGATWWAGADWYPFGPVPQDRASASLLEGRPAGVVGPAFVLAGLLGVVSGCVLLRPDAPAGLRRPARGCAALLAVGALALVPDYTPLALLALWPVLVTFAVTGVQGAQDGLGDILYWHRVNLLLVFAGGLLWAGAGLAAHRRARGGCPHCGRRPRSPASSAPGRERLRRRGRWFVWLAVGATLPYDVTRIAWYAGWSLGLSEEMFRSLQDPPELLAVGLGLGVLSTLGALLTHGLVAGWGERFPRWVASVAGRPVPVMLAVVPAAAVTLVLPPAAVMFAGPVNGGFDLANWGLWLPSLFWMLWAVGLGGATWLYYLRRRGACRHCGGGEPATPRPALQVA